MKDCGAAQREFPEFLIAARKDVLSGRGSIGELYHPQVISRSGDGIFFGSDAVDRVALARRAASPDLAVLSEDVIWCGRPRAGFLGSHRATVIGRLSGAAWQNAHDGPRVQFRVMEDCHVKDGRICEEWRIEDRAAVALQTGRGIVEQARADLEQAHRGSPPFCPENDAPGPYTGHGNDDGWGEALATILKEGMGGASSAMAEQYDPAVEVAYPGGVCEMGLRAAEAFWFGLRAAFPSARFQVHHQVGMEEPNMAPRAAVRWSLAGRHDGAGVFGVPTGTEVHVMGLTHAEFGPRGLRREWTLIDVVAVWTQILAGSV